MDFFSLAEKIYFLYERLSELESVDDVYSHCKWNSKIEFVTILQSEMILNLCKSLICLQAKLMKSQNHQVFFYFCILFCLNLLEFKVRGAGDYFLLISRVMSSKACITFFKSLAEVSTNLISNKLALSWPSSNVTSLLTRSVLLPTKTVEQFRPNLSISLIQVST